MKLVHYIKLFILSNCLYNPVIKMNTSRNFMENLRRRIIIWQNVLELHLINSQKNDNAKEKYRNPSELSLPPPFFRRLSIHYIFDLSCSA